MWQPVRGGARGVVEGGGTLLVLMARRRQGEIAVVTKLQARLSGVRFPSGLKYFSVLQNVQIDSGPTQPLIHLVPDFFHGGKTAEA
jgi:hypothetical protein